MNVTKSTEKLSSAAEIDAVALRLSTAFPANGQAMKPQPQRRWLAAIFTAFTLLLAAGGAQAQTVISVTAPHGFYMTGESVPITVTFTEAVAVDTTGGTPQLTLTTGNSGGEGVGTYTSGSGTDTLIFTYTVLAGDNIGEYHGEGANDEFDAALAALRIRKWPLYRRPRLHWHRRARLEQWHHQ